MTKQRKKGEWSTAFFCKMERQVPRRGREGGELSREFRARRPAKRKGDFQLDSD